MIIKKKRMIENVVDKKLSRKKMLDKGFSKV